VLLYYAVSVLLSSSVSPALPTGRDIVRAMHDRYAGAWYHTLTFIQRNTATRPDGAIEHSVWREYATLPGRLRIEFEPADSGAGLLFVGDSQFVFRDGRLTSATAFVHPLLVLGFDVYFDAVERTLALLERLGFDLSTVHADTWDGRPVYVVGAQPGDLRTRQFWIDKERLVFVRLLEPGRQDAGRISDIRFNKYLPVGAAWLSAEVALLIDGQPRWLEEYTEIKTGVPLADALFDSVHWTEARQASSDTSVTLQGFLQEGAAGKLVLVVPLPLEALGHRTFALAVTGDADRWDRWVNRYVEAAGRVSLSRADTASAPLSIAVRQMKEVEPPGTARRTVDRGFTQHGVISLAVIPNRFRWRGPRGDSTGVNPLLLYRVVNQRQAPIRFVMPTNDLLCVTVRDADGIVLWRHASQAVNPDARRIFVTRGGAYRDGVQLPPEAAPRPGRHVATVGLCHVDGSDIDAEFEVR